MPFWAPRSKTHFNLIHYGGRLAFRRFFIAPPVVNSFAADFFADSSFFHPLAGGKGRSKIGIGFNELPGSPGQRH
jgi:hypothetical protein